MIDHIFGTQTKHEYVIAEDGYYNHSFVVYSTIGGEVQEIDDKYLPYYKGEIEALWINLRDAERDISSINSCVNSASLNLTDTVTGVVYALSVQNGELVIARQAN